MAFPLLGRADGALFVFAIPGSECQSYFFDLLFFFGSEVDLLVEEGPGLFH